MKKIVYELHIENINNLQEYKDIYSNIENIIEKECISYFVLDLKNLSYLNHLFIGFLVNLFLNFKKRQIELKFKLSDNLKEKILNTPIYVFLIKFFLIEK